MCTIIQKHAITGLVNISTANPFLDGRPGAYGTVLTSPGTCNGTNINGVTIKATGSTTQGMVRLFITTTGGPIQLIKEITIPANTATSVVPPFQVTVNEPIILDPGQILLASTQNPESFNVFANGTNWVNCDCTDECNCSDQTSVYNTGMASIEGAAIRTVLTALPATALANGTMIPFIDIKGAGNGAIDQCIVSLYINDGLNNWLIWDVPIPAFTQSDVEPTYRTRCVAMINLQPGYLLCSSVNIGNVFNVIAFASDVTNCPCL
jgi:hypothetical protein